MSQHGSNSDTAVVKTPWLSFFYTINIKKRERVHEGMWRPSAEKMSVIYLSVSLRWLMMMRKCLWDVITVGKGAIEGVTEGVIRSDWDWRPDPIVPGVLTLHGFGLGHVRATLITQHAPCLHQPLQPLRFPRSIAQMCQQSYSEHYLVTLHQQASSPTRVSVRPQFE